MKTYRSLILTLSIALSALVAYGVFFSMPSPKDVDAEGFSSARVVKDLEVIAQEPHSVAHPEARDRLLNYLTEDSKSWEETLRLMSIPTSLPGSLPSMPKTYWPNSLL